MIRIGGERPRARRESADQRGQQAKVCIRIEEVAGFGRLHPDVFHPLFNLFADVVAVRQDQWGTIQDADRVPRTGLTPTGSAH
ncbi:hypothetical protein GCM10010428_61250 [Actinosynnema pretiosum subsp. pretiosum]